MYDAEGGAADKSSTVNSAALTVLDQELPHHRRQEKDVSTCDPSPLNTQIAFAPSSLPLPLPPPPPTFPLLSPRPYPALVSSPSCTSPHTSPSSPQQVLDDQHWCSCSTAATATAAAARDPRRWSPLPLPSSASHNRRPFSSSATALSPTSAVCLSPGLSSAPSQSTPRRQTSALAPAPNGRGAIGAPPDTCKIPVLIGPDLELRSSKAAAQAVQRSISGTKDLSLVLTSRAASDSCKTALQDDKCTRGVRYKFDEHCADMEGDAENPQDAVRMKFIQKQKLDGAGHLSRWSNREKYLVAISCLLFLTCIAFVVLAYTRDREQKVHHPGYCLSAKCVNTAAQLMAAMDTTADPCDDFFQFACGQWNRRNVIPEDKHSYNTFEKLHDELQIILKDLLEESPMAHDSNATLKAKTLYKSCINMTQIRNIGDEPLRSVTLELGGWPIILENWDSSSFVLEEVLGNIRLKYNAPILIGSWVGADDKNSSLNIIQINQFRLFPHLFILMMDCLRERVPRATKKKSSLRCEQLDQPGLGMPSREYYLQAKSESEYVQAYLNFMRGVVSLLGSTEIPVDDQLLDLLEFETKLANVTRPQAERHDTGALYKKMSISQLQQLVPQMDWLVYLRGAVSPVLSGNDEVVVFAVEYLQDMMTIVRQTDTRTLANYIIWRVVMMLAPELTESYQQVHSKYKMVLHGVMRDKVRWKKCVEYANDQMGLAVGAMFIRDNFRRQSKQTALDMIEDIRAAFNELLDENEWMDEETKDVAREKANAMNARIGYPDFITEKDKLDAKYQELLFEERHYFNNVLAMKRFEAQKIMSKLGKPVEKDEWEQEPAVVNAFYNSNSNDIAGILQPLFYSEHFPKSLNYGGIGVVIGHEITHGFDDKGRQYDKDGNLKQWWDNHTIQAFRDRAQCIIDQYSGFKLEQTGLYINGKNTQGENIADNGGLKQAYRAYRRWVEKHGEETPLPGIELTHDQLFFLNYAQIWCGEMRDEEALHGIRTSVHSPGPIRVLGPLSNSEDFSLAYGCPLGSRMNPKHKCSVW